MVLSQTPLAKLFSGDAQEAVRQIMQHYRDQGSTVVNFLYFANVMRGRLIEDSTASRQHDYAKSLVASDFLLPDGIALQMFYRRTNLGRREKIWLHNLNGTDFIPLLLTRLFATWQQTHVAIYSSYDPVIGKGEEWLAKGATNFEKQFGHHVDFLFHNAYRQSSIDDFTWDDYEQSCASLPNRILLVCK